MDLFTCKMPMAASCSWFWCQLPFGCPNTPWIEDEEEGIWSEKGYLVDLEESYVFDEIPEWVCSASVPFINFPKSHYIYESKNLKTTFFLHFMFMK